MKLVTDVFSFSRTPCRCTSLCPTANGTNMEVVIILQVEATLELFNIYDLKMYSKITWKIIKHLLNYT
jgi:hypothetical protein